VGKDEEDTSLHWREKCKENYGFDPLESIKATGKLCTGTNMVLEVVDS
jgi:hypothetical protein